MHQKLRNLQENHQNYKNRKRCLQILVSILNTFIHQNELFSETFLSGKRLNSSDDEEIIQNKPKKRKIIDSEDDDVENSNIINSNKKEQDVNEKKRELVSKDHTDDKISTKLRRFNEDSEPHIKSTPTKSKGKEQKLVQAEKEVNGDDSNQGGIALESDHKVYQHEKHDFLKPENIRDINKNRPNSPDYDPRTLYVPESFLKQCTPGHLQWWKLKSQYFDCIFFFKVGKFYELYHSDAVIGVKELGLTFMKGDYAHSGFPETAYDKMASALVERGYKVARVEQTETPAMMEKRCQEENKKSKFDKVVRREICQVASTGTQNYSTGLCAMSKGQYSANSNYILTIAEKKLNSLCSRFGITFVDTTIGDFFVGEFEDDNHCSRLRTILSLKTPVLILHERTELSENLAKVLKGINVIKEKLTNEKQFWNGSKALKFLAESVYKTKDDWPDCLKQMQGDHLHPNEESTLALKALGGCLWYLKYNLLDQQVLTGATFSAYIPPDQNVLAINIKERKQIYMILDAVTLHNLNVNGPENSLISKLDYCCTQFGKRLLKDMVCSPSCELDEIKARQQAVLELTENIELLSNCRALLNSLSVDIQRSVTQIGQMGNKDIHQKHPQSRAILYEAQTYGKNKIIDFVAALDSFEHLMSLPQIFQNCKSSMLKVLTQTSKDGGQFVNLSNELSKIKASFNVEEAKKNGFILPGRNSDDDYEMVLNEIEDLEREIKVYLKEQEKILGCKLSYFGQDRKRYQIEVPESHFKKVPNGYNLENSKGKGKNTVNRYTTEETKEYLVRMQELEAKKKSVLDDFGRKVFEKFSTNYMQFKQIVNMTAKLDVLTALAEFSRNLSVSCVPDVLDMAKNPGDSFITIENGVHPLMNPDEYIPNGISIGKGGHFELITGEYQ